MVSNDLKINGAKTGGLERSGMQTGYFLQKLFLRGVYIL